MSVVDFSPLRSNVIGEGAVFDGPYGPRRITYVDHAASGRGYRPIEQRSCFQVLPTYANTHTETSFVGAQTTAFREEARRAIRAATGCTDEDAVVFTGSGATGAIQALLRCMGLTRPCCDPIDALIDRVFAGRKDDPPVAVTGPWEHHSVWLALKESVCEVVTVKECDTDGIDLDDLASVLKSCRGRRVIGAFSAGSNVTGRLTNVPAVARCLHDAGAVAFFDYAAAGPYVDIDMGAPGLGYADAVFLSPHKFLGGPGSPGVLLAKKRLFANRVPHAPGGGTVSLVTPHRHSYLSDVEHREEGGTPNIVGAIKAGLAFKLKSSVGAEAILAAEQDHARRLIAALEGEPGVTVLGNTTAPRLGIVSFLVAARSSTGEEKLLHHNFVVALLNDLFGIQARGGNSCAGPYSHRLLGLRGEAEDVLADVVEEGWQGVKPGWTRVSFGFYDTDDTVDFVAEAVKFIARRGVSFLADYNFDPKSGSWTRKGWRPQLLSLESPVVTDAPTLPESERWGYLADAAGFASVPRGSVEMVPTPFESVRWFWVAGEV